MKKVAERTVMHNLRRRFITLPANLVTLRSIAVTKRSFNVLLCSESAGFVLYVLNIFTFLAF